jgi:glycosyltransferase involved in cell wall biosynthesis
VGRLHQQKGVDVLLEAVYQLLQQYPDRKFCLQLIGDGPQKNELLGLTEELGLSQYVVFFGKTDQVFKYLQQADVFILPSRAEGLSNALLEAMVCGLPVVVSKIPGNTDVIEHDQNGLLFAVDDSDSLATSLNSMLTQSDLRERLGEAARITANNHYNLDYVADCYIELYQDLLSTTIE